MNYELEALNEALRKGHKRWGNYQYELDQIMEERMSPSEKRKLAESRKKNANNMKARINRAKAEEENAAKAANLERKKKKHFNAKTQTLKRIAKMCKWECQGEKCWAHEQKMCPYIHKGEPGWNAEAALKKKRGGRRNMTRRRRN